MSLRGFLFVIISVSFTVTGQTLLKSGMTIVGPIDKTRLQRFGKLMADVWSRWQIWIGFTLYGLAAITWILALSTVPLSIAYPFLGLSYVAIAAISVTLLGEWLTPAQWVGIALVVFGVVLVALTGTG